MQEHAASLCKVSMRAGVHAAHVKDARCSVDAFTRQRLPLMLHDVVVAHLSTFLPNTTLNRGTMGSACH